jgi:hypothetical protein
MIKVRAADRGATNQPRAYRAPGCERNPIQLGLDASRSPGTRVKTDPVQFSHFNRDGFTIAADLELGAKVFAAVTLVLPFACVVLGCVILTVFYG